MYNLEDLSQFPFLISAFSTIPDGNMSFGWGGEREVAGNKKEFLKKARIPFERCVQMEIVDDIVIQAIDNPHGGHTMARGKAIKADALVTNKKNIFLFLVVADCLPIIFYDTKQSIVALAHLGWKSTERGLAKQVVRFMSYMYWTKPEDLIVGIGPGIRKESYVFQKPLERKIDAGWKEFLIDYPDGKMAMDVAGYNKAQLLSSGVLEKSIVVSDVDTAKSQNFFSHCRSRETGEREGRFAAVVGMA